MWVSENIPRKHLGFVGNSDWKPCESLWQFQDPCGSNTHTGWSITLYMVNCFVKILICILWCPSTFSQHKLKCILTIEDKKHASIFGIVVSQDWSYFLSPVCIDLHPCFRDPTVKASVTLVEVLFLYNKLIHPNHKHLHHSLVKER